jgi:hypothetical protein
VTGPVDGRVCSWVLRRGRGTGGADSAFAGASLRRIVGRTGQERATICPRRCVAAGCGVWTEATGVGVSGVGSVGSGEGLLGDGVLRTGAPRRAETLAGSGDGAPMIECAACCQPGGNTLANAAAAAASAVITTIASPLTA